MPSLKEFKESLKRWVWLPKTKLDYYTFRKLRALKSRDVGQESWYEWFRYLTRDVSLSPTLHERVQEGTQRTLLQNWMMNYADNLLNIRYGDDATAQIPENFHQSTIADLILPTPVLEMEEGFDKTTEVLGHKVTYSKIKGVKVKYPPEGGAVVVGRGPSLFQNKHCEMLAEAIRNGEYTGLVIASDGALIPLLEAGVIPHLTISVDGAPIIKKWFEHPLVERYGKEINWVVTVTVAHEVYEIARKAGVKTFWFNPMFDDWKQNESWTRLQRLMSRTKQFMHGVPTANSGGNAGACAWIMAMDLLKRSPVALIGIDFGYPEGTKLEDTHYYSGILREAKGDVNIIKQTYKEFYHPTFKTKAFVDMVFYHYREAFIEMQQTTPLWYRLYGGTINCTEGGTLFGQGITCMPFKRFLEEHKK